jgi:head-tail adaptor
MLNEHRMEHMLSASEIENSEVTKEMYEEAKEAWADCRKDIQLSIAANKVARNKYRLNATDENKKAYDETRKLHANAIETIKKVRPYFWLVESKFLENQPD